jgi:uncharacterized delta-60 repeat protein
MEEQGRIGGRAWLGSLLGALLLAAGLVGAPTAAVQAASDKGDEAQAVALQADGKIVAAGRSLNAQNNGTWTFALARYNPDGSLDPTFGRSGRISLAIGPHGSEAYAVAVQADGKIVAAGRAFQNSAASNPLIALARFNADGTLDPSFGRGGVQGNTIGAEATAWGMALTSSGQIVVVGEAHARVGGESDFVVVRYNADGSPDPTFGQGGLVTADFNGGSDVARAVVAQPDGKVVVGGYVDSGGRNDVALLRLDSSGQADASFGSGGTVVSALGGKRDSEAHALALQQDGGLVVGGYLHDGWGKRFTVARFSPDGSLDPKDGGWVQVSQLCSSCFNDIAQAVTVQLDGKILAAGHSNQTNSFDTVVARYNADGSLDSAFGGSGLVTSSLGGKNADWADAIASVPDGTVVIVGTAAPNVDADFLLAHYDTSGGLTTSVTTDFNGLSAVVAGPSR